MICFAVRRIADVRWSKAMVSVLALADTSVHAAERKGTSLSTVRMDATSSGSPTSCDGGEDA